MSELDQLPSPSPRLWVLAGVGAIAVHAACAAFAFAHMNEDEQEALGAPAIEIGMQLASPRTVAPDLPPGPEQDASAASPAVQEQKAVTEASELPKETPVESEDPDRVVTTADNDKPKKEETVVAAVTAAPSEQSIAAEATAAPSIAAVPEAERAVAPAQGIGESAARIRASWQKELISHFDRNKRYPTERSAKAAEIVVTFVLDRTGHIVSSSIVRGSGDAAFDQAAIAMLQRSDPVPAPPALVADEGLSFTLPVIFRVKGK